MNRTCYFNYIEEKLEILSHRILKRGKLNILDLNIHSETFFAELLNILYNLDLYNLNIQKQNVEGIDLLDEKNKIIAQVSSTSTKRKIENSLDKNILKTYAGYRFKFISISKDATNLRNSEYLNPHGVLFSPMDDIIDIGIVLKIVLNMKIEKQKDVYEFIKKELGRETDIIKLDSNLTSIINLLASENLDENIESLEINEFQIERKIEFNDLLSIKDTIDDNKIYYHKLNEKYDQFDCEGVNKSFSVFQLLKRQYRKISKEKDDSSDIFFGIIDNIIKIIIESKNYVEIPYEELELCVYIIVVDAFVRCKIFENPEGYNHVITR